MLKHFVYELRLTGNPAPFYIGKGTGRERPYVHFHLARNGEKSLKANIIRKAWRENVEIEVGILFETDVEDDAFAEESRLISIYGRRGIDEGGILANQTLGGDGKRGYVMSDETRAKIGKANAGRVKGPLSDEHKAKVSAANKGRIKSEETCKRISDAKKGKPRGPHSPETRAKIAESNRRRVLSAESRQRMSDAHKGQPATVFSDEARAKISASKIGKPRSAETVKKMSEAMKAKWAEPEIRAKMLAGFAKRGQH